MEPGDKVICVDDAWFTDKFEHFDCPNGLPTMGRIYVVRNTFVRNGAPAVTIVGFPIVRCDIGVDWGYYAWRFRKQTVVRNCAVNAMANKG